MILAGAGDVQWGTVAQALGGGFSGLSLLWAIGLFSGQRRDRRRQQATKVSGWYDWIVSDPDADELDVQVIVRNASDQPIYSVTVFYMSPVRWRWRRSPVNVLWQARFIAPHSDRHGQLRADEVRLAMESGYFRNREQGFDSVRILFMDASGREWERAEAGSLMRIRQLHMRIGPDGVTHITSKRRSRRLPIWLQ
jgi:hypothetical protein